MINAQRGQSLFEVVVALAVSALIIMALVSLVSNSIRNANFSKNKTLAGVYVQEANEWLRGQRDSDVVTFGANIEDSIGIARCFNDLLWTNNAPCDEGDVISGTPFSRQITFGTSSVDVSGVMKTLTQADIVVFWTDSQGYHEVKSATNFSDWRER